jgi:hypothetical protein
MAFSRTESGGCSIRRLAHMPSAAIPFLLLGGAILFILSKLRLHFQFNHFCPFVPAESAGHPDVRAPPSLAPLPAAHGIEPLPDRVQPFANDSAPPCDSNNRSKLHALAQPETIAQVPPAPFAVYRYGSFLDFILHTSTFILYSTHPPVSLCHAVPSNPAVNRNDRAFASILVMV